jgi:hypothetical protein
MMTLAVALLAVPTCAGAGTWCGAVVPCRSVSHGRDRSGIERVEIEEDVPGSLPVGQTASVWLVYPGFTPFPAEVGAFRYSVGTPAGTLGLCLLPSVAARQRRARGEPVEGGLALLSFDSSRSETSRFPLDRAFESARADGLLTPGQLRRLDELDHIAARRARELDRAWREFAQSPYLAESRRQLLDGIRGFDDPRPVASRDDLRPERFFDREQRIALRRRGHAIPGRCALVFLPRSARVELSACPLSQLAATWSRRSADAGLPDLRALPEREHEEIDGVTLELKDVPPATSARLVFGLLSAVDGLASAGEPAHP